MHLLFSIFLIDPLSVSSAAVSNALTSSLVLTLRKFISLVVSLVFFGHTFTPQHWLGTALVFGGSIAYSHLGDCRCFSRGTDKSQVQPQEQTVTQPIQARREDVQAQAPVAESNATLTNAAPRRSTRTRNAAAGHA